MSRPLPRLCGALTIVLNLYPIVDRLVKILDTHDYEAGLHRACGFPHIEVLSRHLLIFKEVIVQLRAISGGLELLSVFLDDRGNCVTHLFDRRLLTQVQVDPPVVKVIALEGHECLVGDAFVRKAAEALLNFLLEVELFELFVAITTSFC